MSRTSAALVLVALAAGCGSGGGAAESSVGPSGTLVLATRASVVEPVTVVPSTIDIATTEPAFVPPVTTVPPVTLLPPPTPGLAPADRGPVGAWDTCNGGELQLLDPTTGASAGTVGLAGRPVWSPDGRWIASLDNTDGVVRIAQAETGVVDVVVDLHIGGFSNDSCGTGPAVLGWSPDGRALLLDDLGRLRAVRVDGSGLTTVSDVGQGPVSSSTARWLTNGHVAVAEIRPGSQEIEVREGDPWSHWPPRARRYPRPGGPDVYYRLAVSPAGDSVAVATVDAVPPEVSAPDGVAAGAVLLLDLVDGSTRTISDHSAGSAMTFSHDGSRVAYLGLPGDNVVVAPVDGSGARSYPGLYAYELAWSPSDASIVVGSSLVQRLDLPSGAVSSLGDSTLVGGINAVGWGPATS